MKIITCPLELETHSSVFLESLQAIFSEACNLTAELARQQQCVGRIALHHLAYQALRKEFPQLGAQMACNAIYTVARTFKQLGVTQKTKPLPKLHFAKTAPVFFDQRTLNVKGQQVSMFTLDGRLRFQLDLPDHAVALLEEGEIKEVVLSRKEQGFELSFYLQSKAPELPAHLSQKDSTSVLIDSP